MPTLINSVGNYIQSLFLGQRFLKYSDDKNFIWKKCVPLQPRAKVLRMTHIYFHSICFCFDDNLRL